MGRFETEVLTQEANLSALADLSGRWIDRVHARRYEENAVAAEPLVDAPQDVLPALGPHHLSVSA